MLCTLSTQAVGEVDLLVFLLSGCSFVVSKLLC